MIILHKVGSLKSIKNKRRFQIMKKILSLIFTIITVLSVITITYDGVSTVSNYLTEPYVSNEPQFINVRKDSGILYSKITAIGQYMLTSQKRVNIQTSAESSYEKFDVVKRNTAVTVTSIKNNWEYIENDWIWIDYAIKLQFSTTLWFFFMGVPLRHKKRLVPITTVCDSSFYQEKTSRTYKGISINSVFYINTKGTVVINATVLSKLYTRDILNNICSKLQSIANFLLITTYRDNNRK